MYLEKEELNNIVGGASAAIFNAFARIFRTMYDIGYEIGSTIRRLVSKKTVKSKKGQAIFRYSITKLLQKRQIIVKKC